MARLVEYVALPTMLLLLCDLRFRPRWLSVAVLAVAVSGHVIPVSRDLEGGLAVRADEAAFWDRAVTWLNDPERRDVNYRVEVVSTWGHWESYFLATHDIPITRGWFRQDDFPVNRPLYSGDLDASSYKEWLRSLGVRYVVLPNEQLDYSARLEAEILRSPGHGGLKLVYPNDPNVQIYELPDPTPILTRAPEGPLAPHGDGARGALPRPLVDRGAAARVGHLRPAGALHALLGLQRPGRRLRDAERGRDDAPRGLPRRVRAPALRPDAGRVRPPGAGRQWRAPLPGPAGRHSRRKLSLPRRKLLVSPGQTRGACYQTDARRPLRLNGSHLP